MAWSCPTKRDSEFEEEYTNLADHMEPKREQRTASENTFSDLRQTQGST